MTENNPYNTEKFSDSDKVHDEVHNPYPIRPRNNNGHIWVGLFLLLVGSVFLLNRLGIHFPDFIFSWQMFLIAIGIFVGIRKEFQGSGWLIMILIGSLFLINEYFVFGELRRFILPIILIGMGLFFIMRPKKNYVIHDESGTGLYETDDVNSMNGTSEDFIDTTSIFGGTKKKVFSKNFKGGSMVNIFGGSEINLTQADINGTAVIEVTTMFGGATLLVPSHWNVVSDAVAILGEVKDKRVMQNIPENNKKTLLIKGTVVLGGIDVKSY